MGGVAGRWEVSGRTVQGRIITATWEVREDGTVIQGSGIAGARLSIRDGKVVLEGAVTDAVLTLHDGDGRRVLSGPGQIRGGGGIGQVQIEAFQVK